MEWGHEQGAPGGIAVRAQHEPWSAHQLIVPSFNPQASCYNRGRMGRLAPKRAEQTEEYGNPFLVVEKVREKVNRAGFRGWTIPSRHTRAQRSRCGRARNEFRLPC